MDESFDTLPDNLPQPVNDQLCNHLLGMQIPDMTFLSTQNNLISILNHENKFLVLYFFPQMALDMNELPPNWNSIPGARGCTPQNITINQNLKHFLKYDARLIGVSTQSNEELLDISLRRKLSQEFISDSQLKLKKKLDLPTFKTGNKTRYKRLTLVLNKSKIVGVFYPIFPPDKHAFEILDWLEHNSKKY